uniref:Fatty acyl-CoA reductase n=1 Tax=Homalodisca liturata TaxID=320908 RepID=A0A1B6IKS1_9HEMI
MMEEEPFDLFRLSELSLNLKTSIVAPTRPVFPKKQQDLSSQLHDQDPLQLLGEKSFAKPKETAFDEIGTPIQEFFRDSHVFITGGTGFLGKLLTEKLIRSTPNVGKIYLLMRAKRGKSAQERFHELFQDKVFLRMKTEVPDYLSKVSFVDGDLSEPDLGLSEADRQMLSDKVNIVFHSAADVRFLQPLRLAIESNLQGGKRVLDLAKGMKNLQSYVHVSTAYSFCVQRVIKEEVPKMSITREDVLENLKSKTDEEIEDELERIMQGWPNTYAFTKALCEDLIRDESEGMPICIFRPSVVGPSYREPVRGWTDNVNGPFGLLLGITLGIFHCFWTNQELILDLVPVDYVVNGMIAAAWQTALCRNQLLVYNCTSLSEQRVDWKTFRAFERKYKDHWPFSQAVWYDSFFLNDSKFIDDICNIFLHKIPGLFLDKLAVLSGQKPRMMRIYDKIDALRPQAHYFSFAVWEFENNNLVNLRSTLNKEDKILFNFDFRDINYEEYFIVGKLGLRYYFLKDQMETMPAAKRKYMWLYWAHNSLKLLSGLVVLKLLVFTAHVLPI